ncbi:hypothetical protein CL629_02255 [bacterium]|nr:hypothetical protein [bacterium]|tara:strand:- start:19 stop:411 length:393 start_codon:yes stop_codon:yes gene_type:complete
MLYYMTDDYHQDHPLFNGDCIIYGCDQWPLPIVEGYTDDVLTFDAHQLKNKNEPKAEEVNLAVFNSSSLELIEVHSFETEAEAEAFEAGFKYLQEATAGLSFEGLELNIKNKFKLIRMITVGDYYDYLDD